MNYLDKLNFDYGEFRKCTTVFKPKFAVTLKLEKFCVTQTAKLYLRPHL